MTLETMDIDPKRKRYIIDILNPVLEEAVGALNEDMRKAIVVNVQLGGGGEDEGKKEDEEEEEEEDDEDIPEPPPITRTGNRQSVSAEAYGDWNKQNKQFVAPVYEKTEENMARIREILDKSFVFANVDDKQLDVLYKAMNKVTLKPEEKVITEGDVR